MKIKGWCNRLSYRIHESGIFSLYCAHDTYEERKEKQRRGGVGENDHENTLTWKMVLFCSFFYCFFYSSFRFLQWVHACCLVKYFYWKLLQNIVINFEHYLWQPHSPHPYLQAFKFSSVDARGVGWWLWSKAALSEPEFASQKPCWSDHSLL